MESANTDNPIKASRLPWGTVFRVALFALGAGLLGVLLVRMDFTEVQASLQRVGWLFLAALAVHLTGIVLMARGWYETIDRRASRAGFPEVLRAYWSGHVINSLTPVKSLGDVLAGSILKDRGKLAGEEMVSSLILLNFIASLATLVFLIAGPLVCLAAGFHSDVTVSLFYGVAGVFVPMVLFYVLLRLGAASRVIRLVGKLPGVRLKDPRAWLKRARSVDGRVREFLAAGTGRFARALSCWLLVRLLQVAEVLILLLALLPGHSTSELLLLAVLTQTAALLVGGLLAFVPGQIGVAEGGSALLFGLIGQPPVVGFSMELVRRVCKLIGIAAGLAAGSSQIFKSRPANAIHSRRDRPAGELGHGGKEIHSPQRP
jgi:uncharacterized protein (TIRG00374 family)